MKKSKDYQRGYEQGQRDEAKTTLENLYIILEEMKAGGMPDEHSHIIRCIRDLEEFLGIDRKTPA